MLRPGAARPRLHLLPPPWLVALLRSPLDARAACCDAHRRALAAGHADPHAAAAAACGWLFDPATAAPRCPRCCGPGDQLFLLRVVVVVVVVVDRLRRRPVLVCNPAARNALRNALNAGTTSSIIDMLLSRIDQLPPQMTAAAAAAAMPAQSRYCSPQHGEGYLSSLMVYLRPPPRELEPDLGREPTVAGLAPAVCIVCAAPIADPSRDLCSLACGLGVPFSRAELLDLLDHAESALVGRVEEPRPRGSLDWPAPLLAAPVAGPIRREQGSDCALRYARENLNAGQDPSCRLPRSQLEPGEDPLEGQTRPPRTPGHIRDKPKSVEKRHSSRGGLAVHELLGHSSPSAHSTSDAGRGLPRLGRGYSAPTSQPRGVEQLQSSQLPRWEDTLRSPLDRSLEGLGKHMQVVASVRERGRAHEQFTQHASAECVVLEQACKVSKLTQQNSVRGEERVWQREEHARVPRTSDPSSPPITRTQAEAARDAEALTSRNALLDAALLLNGLCSPAYRPGLDMSEETPGTVLGATLLYSAVGHSTSPSPGHGERNARGIFDADGHANAQKVGGVSDSPIARAMVLTPLSNAEGSAGRGISRTSLGNLLSDAEETDSDLIVFPNELLLSASPSRSQQKCDDPSAVGQQPEPGLFSSLTEECKVDSSAGDVSANIADVGRGVSETPTGLIIPDRNHRDTIVGLVCALPAESVSVQDASHLDLESRVTNSPLPAVQVRYPAEIAANPTQRDDELGGVPINETSPLCVPKDSCLKPHSSVAVIDELDVQEPNPRSHSHPQENATVLRDRDRRPREHVNSVLHEVPRGVRSDYVPGFNLPEFQRPAAHIVARNDRSLNEKCAFGPGSRKEANACSSSHGPAEAFLAAVDNVELLLDEDGRPIAETQECHTGMHAKPSKFDEASVDAVDFSESLVKRPRKENVNDVSAETLIVRDGQACLQQGHGCKQRITSRSPERPALGTIRDAGVLSSLKGSQITDSLSPELKSASYGGHTDMCPAMNHSQNAMKFEENCRTQDILESIVARRLCAGSARTTIFQNVELRPNPEAICGRQLLLPQDNVACDHTEQAIELRRPGESGFEEDVSRTCNTRCAMCKTVISKRFAVLHPVFALRSLQLCTSCHEVVYVRIRKAGVPATELAGSEESGMVFVDQIDRSSDGERIACPSVINHDPTDARSLRHRSTASVADDASEKNCIAQVNTRTQRARRLVAVVKEMLFSKAPWELKTQGIPDELIGCRDPRSWLTVSAAGLSFDMLAVMRVVYTRFGVSFQAGRIQFPVNKMRLPPRAEMAWLVESACPRRQEDYQTLQSAGARAWNETFPDLPFCADDLDVRKVAVRMFSLIGMYPYSDRPWSAPLDDYFQLDRVSVQTALQNAYRESDNAIRFVFEVDMFHSEAVLRAREEEKFSKTLCDPGYLLCGICGLSSHSVSHPFPLSACKRCEKALCSLCICVIFGAHEFLNSMQSSTAYHCPCCRMEDLLLGLKQPQNEKATNAGASRSAFPSRGRKSITRKRREANVRLPPLIVSPQVFKVVLGLEPDNPKRDLYTGFAYYCDYTNRMEFGPENNTKGSSGINFCLVCKGTNVLLSQESSTEANTADEVIPDASSRGDSDNVGYLVVKGSTPSTDRIKGGESAPFLLCSIPSCSSGIHVSCIINADRDHDEQGKEWVCLTHRCSLCGKESDIVVRCRCCASAYCSSHIPAFRTIHIYGPHSISCPACTPLLLQPTLSPLQLGAANTQTRNIRMSKCPETLRFLNLERPRRIRHVEGLANLFSGIDDIESGISNLGVLLRFKHAKRHAKLSRGKRMKGSGVGKGRHAC